MTTERVTGASLAINQYAKMWKDLPFKEGAKLEHGKLYRSRINHDLVFQYDARDDHFDVFIWRYD